MENERYELVIAKDHATVRLTDRETGEIHEFKGPKALHDALGVLADWRDEDDERPSSYHAWDADAHGDDNAVIDGCTWPNETCRGHMVEN